MITGDIKNKIDQIWDTFFVAGITNPITVLEQMTYIFFMKMLDDKQLHEEANAQFWGAEVQNPTFPQGKKWVNPEAVSDEEKKAFLMSNCAGMYSRIWVPTTCSKWFAKAYSNLSNISEPARKVLTAAI